MWVMLASVVIELLLLIIFWCFFSCLVIFEWLVDIVNECCGDSGLCYFSLKCVTFVLSGSNIISGYFLSCWGWFNLLLGPILISNLSLLWTVILNLKAWASEISTGDSELSLKLLYFSLAETSRSSSSSQPLVSPFHSPLHSRRHLLGFLESHPVIYLPVLSQGTMVNP